jgi:hypothetical protein
MNKFNKIYNSIVNSIYPEIKTFIKKRFLKHAIKMIESGTVLTREGKVNYSAGDYLAFDKQGGQYPITEAEFNSLYEPTDNPEYWLSKPIKVKMFKTNKEMKIEMPFGILTADPGDWVEIKDDGTYGAPRKQYCIDNDYMLKENDN